MNSPSAVVVTAITPVCLQKRYVAGAKKIDRDLGRALRLNRQR
jgi:hypothetical protein